MQIKELINMASEKDEKFKKQIDHRLNKRKKTPEFDWLMTRLVEILGEEYVKQAAKEAIEEAKRSTENAGSDGKAV